MNADLCMKKTTLLDPVADWARSGLGPTWPNGLDATAATPLPLSAADIGCFRLSINHVRLHPARLIGHRATTPPANQRAGDAFAACLGHLRL